MYELSQRIKERVAEYALSLIEHEIIEEGMPTEYACIAEKRVYSNLMNELKILL